VNDSNQWQADGHVIVCGLRGVGLRTVEQLYMSGVSVVVVDDDPDLRLARIVEDWGIPRIHKSARLGDGLIEAGLDRAQAVVCAEASEVTTLEIALRVREARPDVRLVVEMANPAVGSALERATGAGSVLDVAALAAPSFIEACLGRPSHHMTLGGVQFAVVNVTVTDEPGYNATFRSHFGDLAPVAVVPAGGSEIACCPGRDHPVNPGDRVAVLGPVDQLKRMDISVNPTEGSASASRSWYRILRGRLRALMATNSKGLVFSVAGLFLLLIISTALLRMAYVVRPGKGHLSVLAAAYFSVETAATVGYGDYSYGAQSPWLQVFAILFIVLGATLVSISFALLTNILVSRRIEQSLGRRRVPGMVGHIVVVGLGSVGIRVVEGLLAAGRRVVVVEQDDTNRYLGRARALGVPVVIADATQRQTHAVVNLSEASAVAVLTSADLTNIETGLAVRESLGTRWSEVPVVLRVFDRDLARMMELNFGFQHVRSTSALAAPWFVGASLGLDILETFYVDRQPFIVGRLLIAPSGGLQGLAMQDLSARTRVIAIRRAKTPDTLEHPPRRDTRFEARDEVFLLGPYEELLSVLRRDQIAERGLA
jgi:Trk K+ transport system NAD-binding subunit